MGKQQQAPPARRSTAMSAPPPPKRRKKKGRPSLLDLQKRSLRLEQQLQQQQPKGRRSNRRSAGSADEDDDGPASGSGRREKKLRLVMGLHDGSPKQVEKARKATDGHEGWCSLLCAIYSSELSDSGPTTPLPNKKLLHFILDRLQKKDTYGVFSEPVDPEELPDYHDIVKHPMDFSTILMLEECHILFWNEYEYSILLLLFLQFCYKDDVFLISTNAMCYNSPDTIYYRQARGIQEIAKKDFENLRQDSDASDPEPEPELELEPEPEEPKPQPRRGRPPNKNNAKQKVGKPPTERATADFSGATLATAANIGRHAQADVDLSRRAMDKAMMDMLRASFANRRNEHNWSGERKFERFDECSGFKLSPFSRSFKNCPLKGYRGTWSAKMGKRPILMEDSRRSTYCETQPSNSIYELPVGVQLQQSYSRSLARFAAQLGPVCWEIASRRIERSLAPGTKFGRGWVGDGETPNSFQPPVLAAFSETTTPQDRTAASGEQPCPSMSSPPATEACAGNDGSHLAGSQPDATPYASTSTTQRMSSEALASQQCGSLPQISINRAERTLEMKGSPNNLHGHPGMQQTANGFNAVPGPMMFPHVAQLVVNQMQTHTAD
ncbi:Bromodomain and PHD finger-containing protein 3 [Zea mays]|uniref:Bromodomain and PHD finger-containing protein 3 n=1 Tax=Zea mays TaxID=4577 RepID=A0A3L6G538_MAIZE|nr:Bromodomain and PHD finger-containing protein 3 [Zea mays]